MKGVDFAVLCGHCKKQIPLTAKICPFCNERVAMEVSYEKPVATETPRPASPPVKTPAAPAAPAKPLAAPAAPVKPPAPPVAPVKSPAPPVAPVKPPAPPMAPAKPPAPPMAPAKPLARTVPVSYETAPAAKTHSRKPIALLAVLAVLLLLVLGLLCFYLFYWNSDQRVRTAVSNGNYSKAVALMNENDRFLKDDALLQLFSEKQESLVEDYLSEKCSYAQVQEDLMALCALDNTEIRDAAEDSLADLEKVKACRDSYAQAETALKQGDYEAALAAFRAVSENDATYYALAQEQIEDTTALYQNALKDDAEQAFQAGSYAEAVTKLENAVVVHAADETYTEECHALMGEYLREWIDIQRNAGNYFGEDGAALLAVSYEDILPEDVKADTVISDGIIHEQVQLLLLYNEVRAELGISDLAYDERVTAVAAQQAAKMLESADGSVAKPDSLLNAAGIDWQRWSVTKMTDITSAQAALDAYGGEYDGYGEFKREYAAIGIGIAFDRDEKNCSWYVLTID